MVATTYKDLFEDLNPCVRHPRRFGKEVVVNYYPNAPAKKCSLVREIRIEEGTTEDLLKSPTSIIEATKLLRIRKIFRLVRG